MRNLTFNLTNIIAIIPTGVTSTYVRTIPGRPLYRTPITIALTILAIFLNFSLITPAHSHGNSKITFTPLPYSSNSELPPLVKVDFAEPLNTKTGELILLDPSGKNLISKAFINATSISGKPKPASSAGDYTILFTVLGADGSTITGSATFELLPNAKLPLLPPDLTSNPDQDNNPLTKSSNSQFIFFLSLLLLPISFVLFIWINRKKPLVKK